MKQRRSRPGLTSSERDELARLRNENRVLREERDILKRALHDPQVFTQLPVLPTQPRQLRLLAAR